MRSSGSTRSPRAECPVRLFIALAGEDHPKACTGRRLLARGLARPARTGSRTPGRPITLDPHAALPLSAMDRSRVDASGLLAVDCSWNQLAARGRLPTDPTDSGHPPPRRRLPILVAANPQHYGRMTELNTVEACPPRSTCSDVRSRPHDFSRGSAVDPSSSRSIGRDSTPTRRPTTPTR
jgi:ribosome biogenesis protein Tsr3